MTRLEKLNGCTTQANMSVETPPLEELIKQWEKDSQIDSIEPGRELLKIPIIHSKYNKYLLMHNLASRRASLEYDKIRKIKWMYYTGKLDSKQLDEFGWEPFQFTLKSDIQIYIDGDDDLNKLKRKRAYHEEASKFCEYIMKELNNRTYQLREYMIHERFIAGAR